MTMSPHPGPDSVSWSMQHHPGPKWVSCQQTIFTLSKKPIKITVQFCFPRPKWHCFWDPHTDQLLLLSPAAPTYVIRTPDPDNCIKLLLDALQNVCCANDCLLAHLDAAKICDHTQSICSDSQKQEGCTIIKKSQKLMNAARTAAVSVLHANTTSMGSSNCKN